ncbi:glycosyltransferase [Hoeflea ulvae]|uniref:Glycosyltransferase family 4 protein n=1 Tax=Hoeflea ulvae TaxID=2983764 RepID=A0ABT3YCE3_9HYPH|nr:glycosyltransferase family 4 protein [Hoeflea ulvae]MCY0093544.1 glycosyltransferase family 4 protein [Hoeflea ulvae]
MHFVFISSLVPVAAPASGYDIANRVIVDAIRLIGHTVSVIGFLQPGHQPAEPDQTRLLGQLEVTNARVGKWQKALWLKDAFLHGEPVSVAKMHAASPAQIRAALDDCGAIDGLILNSVQLPGAFLDVFKAWPCVFVAHNVEARSAADNAANASNPLTRQLFSRDARLLARLEGALCKASRHVFTLAKADLQELGVGQGDRASVLPLVTSVTPPEGPAPRAPLYDAGMIGSWTWAANRAGLDWFLSEIVPRLPEDFTIAIAGGYGATPPPAPGNVRFLGRVDDARAFVRACRIIPLISRTGTGVQLKTIETFEMGLPSVATQNALRGIAARPENCVAAEEPAAFAAALSNLVDRARAGEALDGDGRAFHARQLDGLTAALASGLAQCRPHG